MPHAPLPEPLPLGPFRVAEALDLDVGEKRLRGHDLARPFHGIRSVGRVDDQTARCTALLAVLRSGTAFSHVTAAALWGLPLPHGVADGPLHVVSPAGERRRRQGIVVHAQSRPLRGTFIGILPVVEPLTAWAQCAALLPLDDVVAMGDALAGRWSKHESARELPIERLEATVRAWGCRRGARRLREAMRSIRPRVWSPKETALRLLLVRAGLPEPECNGEVTTDAGESLGHGDLVWRRARLVVEYEGDHHRTDRAQWRRDIARAEAFAEAGWRRLRVTDDDLGDPLLLRRISRHLATQALV